jgi:hypothetical protein
METRFQLSDYSSKEKTAEMQRVLNAQQVLYCLILKVGNEIRITVSRYTFPELSVLRGGKTISVTNKNQLFGRISELVQAMVSEIAGGTTPAQTNPTNNSTQQYDPESDFEAELMEDGKSVRITDYRGNRSVVRIPPQIQGIPVTHIGRHAFFDWTITSVIIPNSVTEIGEGAFANCNSLTSVIIPKNVTSIGVNAFRYCKSLTAINVASDNTMYTAVNGVLYNKDRSVLHTYPTGKKGNYIIPNGVITIETGAFYCCIGLTGVTIPNSVTEIGSMAFRSCTSLTSVTIPNSVTSIDHGVFHQCDGLTSITIPNSVTTIGGAAFLGCTSLTSVIIPNSVTTIGRNAFGNCTSLAGVTFQGNISRANFEEEAFDGNLLTVYYSSNQNGTPGTYRTSNPGNNAVWRKL